jgi:hypothetical protein
LKIARQVIGLKDEKMWRPEGRLPYLGKLLIFFAHCASRKDNKNDFAIGAPPATRWKAKKLPVIKIN